MVIAQLNNLNNLYLSHNKITSRCVWTYFDMPALKVLDVRFNEISPEERETIKGQVKEQLQLFLWYRLIYHHSLLYQKYREKWSIELVDGWWWNRLIPSLEDSGTLMEAIGPDWLRLLEVILFISVYILKARLRTFHDPPIDATDGIGLVGLRRRTDYVSSTGNLYLYLVEFSLLDGPSTHTRDGIHGLRTILISFWLGKWRKDVWFGSFEGTSILGPMLNSDFLLRVDVITWTILECLARWADTGIVFTGSSKGILTIWTLIQLTDIGQIGEEVAIVSLLLPPLCLPKMVGQLCYTFAFGDFVHSNIGLQCSESILEGGSDLATIHLQKITKLRVIHWILRIQFHRLYDRIQHLSHTPAIEVLWLSSWEIGMMPDLHLFVQIDAHHGRSHQEQTVLRVQREIGPEGQLEDEQHFLVG